MRLHGFHPWIVLYGMGGLTSYDPREAFGSKRSDTLANVLIDAAGPVIGFLFAAVGGGGLLRGGTRQRCRLLASLWRLVPHVVACRTLRLSRLLNDVFFICVFWGLVNLLARLSARRRTNRPGIVHAVFPARWDSAVDAVVDLRRDRDGRVRLVRIGQPVRRFVLRLSRLLQLHRDAKLQRRQPLVTVRMDMRAIVRECFL